MCVQKNKQRLLIYVHTIKAMNKTDKISHAKSEQSLTLDFILKNLRYFQ